MADDWAKPYCLEESKPEIKTQNIGAISTETNKNAASVPELSENNVGNNTQSTVQEKLQDKNVIQNAEEDPEVMLSKKHHFQENTSSQSLKVAATAD